MTFRPSREPSRSQQEMRTVRPWTCPIARSNFKYVSVVTLKTLLRLTTVCVQVKNVFHDFLATETWERRWKAV